ncbi:peptidoglycan-binding protein [Streptomyces roseirectus]|uniref:Peptidoglycan-binding protein n=1 Tax=Streptomyces roseirectus TaxID=2768066 RepID=A0A7H0IJK5_9ACTN|nr:peptidoglycan-binding domain-containing protein [Streptomyces roseirectus]QNP72971.1 peptidoglycan-binding protein [Streptomyces roseirectus]
MNEPKEREGPRTPRGPYGHPCPECGALRAPDSTPSCDCAQRATEALREARLADAAAAEDFDPLRIRPYVELAGTAGAPVAGGVKPPVDATMPLRAVPPAPTSAESFPAGDAPTAPLPAVPAGGTGAGGSEVLGGAEGTAASGAVGDLGDVRGVGDADGGASSGNRRRRTVLLATSGAVVAILAVAGFGTGLFAYDAPVRDASPPEDIRAAVPAPAASVAVSSEPPAKRPAEPVPTPAEPAPSASAAPSPSPTPSAGSPSPSSSASPSPSAPESPVGEAGDQRQIPSLTVAPLRRGDTGPEVRELQLRLTQLYLYDKEADGVFDEQVESALKNYQWSREITGDELGVYGAATRERLEKETKEP